MGAEHSADRKRNRLLVLGANLERRVDHCDDAHRSACVDESAFGHGIHLGVWQFQPVELGAVVPRQPIDVSDIDALAFQFVVITDGVAVTIFVAVVLARPTRLPFVSTVALVASQPIAFMLVGAIVADWMPSDTATTAVFW